MQNPLKAISVYTSLDNIQARSRSFDFSHNSCISTATYTRRQHQKRNICNGGAGANVIESRTSTQDNQIQHLLYLWKLLRLPSLTQGVNIIAQAILVELLTPMHQVRCRIPMILMAVQIPHRSWIHEQTLSACWRPVAQQHSSQIPQPTQEKGRRKLNDFATSKSNGYKHTTFIDNI